MKTTINLLTGIMISFCFNLIFISPASAQVFTWMKGSNAKDQICVNGTPNVYAVANVPGSRYGSTTWTDASGTLYLFGGHGFLASGASGWMNDLWKYDPATNQWACIKACTATNQPGVYSVQGVSNSTNRPGARAFAVSWTDNSNNLYLFGGNGFDGTTGFDRLNDLWKYNPSTNQWTWLTGGYLINEFGNYGTQNVPAAANTPGARTEATGFKDGAGNFYLFGGQGRASSTIGYLNDLWKYTPSTNQWTWVNGANVANQNGTYGTKGVAAAGNIPGGRSESVMWTDVAGDAYLFGGYGYPETGGVGYLNDFWKYSPASNQWTWVSGTGMVNQQGNYGSLNVASATNAPGGRAYSVALKDPNDNLYLFSGLGYGNATPLGYLNDLWKYNPVSNQWTWTKGSDVLAQSGIYGTQGMPSVTNMPGSRYTASSFTHPSGNPYLFGGIGYPASGSTGELNDLWQLSFPLGATTSQTNISCSGNSNGVAAVIAGGGTGPYTYTWMPGNPTGNGTNKITGLTAGTYSCTITDGVSASVIVTVNVTSSSAIVATSSQTNISCNALTDGAAMINASGGTGSLTYSWSPSGGTSAMATGLATGNYTCIIKDANNCSGTQTVSITQPTSLTLIATAVNTIVCPGNTTTVTANANGGTGILLYTWVNGSLNSNNIVSPVVPTIYTVTASDANNCSLTKTVSVNTYSLPVISVNSGTICSGQSFTINPTGANTYTISGGSAIASPTSTSSYSVTGTSLQGCVSASAAISTVTVNTLPVVSVNSGAICSGESFTINPTGAATYTITGGSAIVSPTSISSYSVSGTSAAGCVSSTEAVSTVLVNSLPAILVNTSNTLICIGETATLSVSGADSYTWSTSENGATIVVNPTAATDYTVTGTDLNGCVNLTTITQDVSLCTGINEAVLAEIGVYPNPGNGLFNVVIAPAFEARVSVYDVLGKLVYSGNLKENKSTIDIQEQVSGIYILKVTVDGTEKTVRIIKQ